jgi:hypothetical protein
VAGVEVDRGLDLVDYVMRVDNGHGFLHFAVQADGGSTRTRVGRERKSGGRPKLKSCEG